jgi:TPR repeat protein
MGNLASNWRDQRLEASSADVPWTADNLEGVAEELLANVSASGVAIVRGDTEVAGTLVCVVSVGTCVPPPAAQVDPNSGISGRCIRERRTQRCYDTRIDPRVERAASERLGIRSLVAAPMIVGSHCIGLIEAVSDRPGHFDEVRAAVVESGAARAAALIAAEQSFSESLSRDAVPPDCHETANVLQASALPHEVEQTSAEDVHVERSTAKGKQDLRFSGAKEEAQRRFKPWVAVIAAVLLATLVTLYGLHRHTNSRLANSHSTAQALPSDLPVRQAIPNRTTAAPPTEQAKESYAGPGLAAAAGARRGVISDQIRLARAYLSGDGVPKSLEKAASWYIIAGENGSAQAKRRSIELTRGMAPSEIAQIRFDVGKMNMEGIGTRKNFVAAYTWFELSKAAGDVRAEAAEQRLRSQMQPAEVQEGKHRAFLWLQSHVTKTIVPND